MTVLFQGMRVVDLRDLAYKYEIRPAPNDGPYSVGPPDHILRIEFKEGMEGEVDGLLWPVYDSGETFAVILPSDEVPTAVQLIEYNPLSGIAGELSDGRIVRFELR